MLLDYSTSGRRYLYNRLRRRSGAAGTCEKKEERLEDATSHRRTITHGALSSKITSLAWILLQQTSQYSFGDIAINIVDKDKDNTHTYNTT